MNNKNEEFRNVSKPHALPIDAILADLRSDRDGLSSDAAARRLERLGPNRLPEPPKEGQLKRFFKHFHDTLIYILIAAGAVTAVLGHWVDTGVILGVVVINAIIGFIQEGKAEQALEGLRKMLSLQAHALRDGEWRETDAEQLVPGDIVRLRSGDRVPADLRLMEAINLRIEESALTGESMPTAKNTEAVRDDAGVGDRSCMAFSGTLVAAGRGTGVVVATGAQTELGKIDRMISEVQTLATPLTRQMDKFGRTLSIVIVGMAALMFLTGWVLHDFSLDELFIAAIGFAVAAIPEGLPAILTITLAIGVQRMARRKAITRKLNAVETLGSVTVICSDKTGTLTRNEMTVVHLVTGDGRYDAEGSGYAPRGGIHREGRQVTIADHEDLRRLVEIFAVCNDSAIVEDNGQWRVIGEPTEGALKTLAKKAGFSDKGYQRLAVIPFESENKFMATLTRSSGKGTRILMKGAPDRLLDRCARQAGKNGREEPLDRSFWEEQVDALGARGLRVLAAAIREVEEEKDELAMEDLDREMVFAGLVGIIDPPRPEAIAAIKTCRQAGIRVIMITGDHAGTAAAIGQDMGIGSGREAVTGDAIEAASDEELGRMAGESDIFARTSPGHKLRLVQALQARGEVVAMTGDGVNDAPALKQADVGIAMGIKGTEATKGAADIVLSDDNFATIERAVQEGRTIYDNLRKAVVFILPTNGAEGLVVLVAVVFGLELPLTPVQILWVNMVTAVTLALALAFEPSEPGLMSRPPRKTDAPILDALFLWRIAFVSTMIGLATIAVFIVQRRLGMDLPAARTLAVNTLVFGQLFYLFNSRFLHESSLGFSRLFANRVAWLMAGVLTMLQMVFVYAPFMHSWFGSASQSLRYWPVPLGIGLSVFLAVEAEKALLSRRT
ncbi:cation-transporting P-type ATPase [Desulfoprunum benzoelyticum]|uniref:Magnesium-transporting ATPase (P-type) n=1 Tax=Desulfoprunum benzoelyticum TaxID=1506996 RepID=A0A840UXM3_9BACT|nr:cation-transporting P-type ATPase [Desulfoprunum benzoelyticum]MBB5347428.1 magnesium-transporting ATPase (P-type) [Desulfoprunum benzoelyticum]MBM9529692.1 cation-transporting P-type ATPase [Desulfoprunum benzoelyticum]